MACSQFIPSIRIGYLYTYWAPLAFVIAVTMLREAYDDFKRYLRDKELNSQLYKILTYDGIKMVPSSHLKVSDVIIIEKVCLNSLKLVTNKVVFMFVFVRIKECQLILYF
jgi:phospholipid-translocating ATPase